MKVEELLKKEGYKLIDDIVTNLKKEGLKDPLEMEATGIFDKIVMNKLIDLIGKEINKVLENFIFDHNTKEDKKLWYVRVEE